MKLLYTFVFLLLTSIVYGQKSTLFQNVNVRAKELKHDLNKTGDILIFKCERTVYEVVIFNDDFERVIKVRDTQAKISIADIPVGRYIVEALLSDKLIVMTLLRNESFKVPSTDTIIADSSDLFGMKKAPKVEEKVAVVIEEVPLPKEAAIPEEEILGSESILKKTDIAVAGKKAEPKPTAPKKVKKVTSIKREIKKSSSLSLFNTEKEITKTVSDRSSEIDDSATANRIVSTYWVEYKINNGQSSEKIQKLGDQQTVDRMIRKIEIDMKTKAGRLNELIVWTVFDPSRFVIHVRKNKSNFTEVPSDSFSLEPYYKKVNDPDDM